MLGDGWIAETRVCCITRCDIVHHSNQRDPASQRNNIHIFKHWRTLDGLQLATLTRFRNQAGKYSMYCSILSRSLATLIVRDEPLRCNRGSSWRGDIYRRSRSNRTGQDDIDQSNNEPESDLNSTTGDTINNATTTRAKHLRHILESWERLAHTDRWHSQYCCL